MAEASSAIAVESLSKSYQVHERAPGFGAMVRSVFRRRTRLVHAVEDLSFSIAPGERVGFLGPNGAGKTTTLKVLSGLLHPSGGRVRVAGFVPQHREVGFLKRITLVMGQKQQLLWDLPPAETFALNRAIYGISEADFKQTLGELEDLLGIAAIASKPTRQLSLGERMKCELAAALLHRPEILFLDEPTIGLDVAMQLGVREFIRRYNEQRGATVVLTSHYMDDVAALCPRVIVIDKGRLRYDGDLAALARSVRPHKRIALRFGGPVDRALLERVGAVLSFDPGRAVLQVPQEELRQAMSWLLGQTDIADLTVEDPPLEEVMRELFAGEGRAGEPAGAAGEAAS
ncbi:ABC transporter ATP-binding protein [Sorangium cellulosum]|uniref:ABC transporter n=3 Tax=Sorangium cellulosum TaxID=56 RepID=A0A150U0P3_SORCE|nr:ATP-binding cassette domain-containing protein [Sorangium cellulosum]AGP32796.1 ABC transporter [Sorangium cellulosum So0157-2]KYG10348.1 ABC transporter [Sorangium cellulosum]